jgi:Rieske Fe-S protein
MNSHVSRRAVLAVGAAGAAGAGAVALAACNPGGGEGAGTTTPTAAADQTLVALKDVPVGSAVSAKLPDGSAIIVTQPTAGTAACFSAICTHQGCTVAPAGSELHCPCHGSRYNAATGDVLQGPATRPLARVPVHVAGGDVLTGNAPA